MDMANSTQLIMLLYFIGSPTFPSGCYELCANLIYPVQSIMIKMARRIEFQMSIIENVEDHLQKL